MIPKWYALTDKGYGEPRMRGDDPAHTHSPLDRAGEPRMRGDDPVLDTAMHQQIM